MVHKILDLLNVVRGDGAEVDAFGKCLSKKTVGIFVRTTLVRTTGIGRIYSCSERVFQPWAVGELGAVVERDGMPMASGNIAQGLANFAMDSIGVFAADFSQQHITRATVGQRQESAAARSAEHQVAFPISQPPTLIGDVGTLSESGIFASLGGGISTASGSSATSPELLFPVFTQCRMRVDPVIDRGRTHAVVTIAWMLAPQPSGDLLRRPLLSQSRRHELVQLRPLQLASDWPLAAPLLRQPLRSRREIHTVGAVASSFATDRGRRSLQLLSDLFLVESFA